MRYNEYLIAVLLLSPILLAIQCEANKPIQVWGGDSGWNGWSTTGTGWQLVNRERLGNPCPDVPHFESSETGIGTLRSPDFVVKGGLIKFWACGWNGRYGASSSTFRLCSAEDGSVLRSATPPQQNDFTVFEWYARDIIGRKVYFEAEDNCSDIGYAWLGLAKMADMDIGKTDSSRVYATLPFDGNSFGTWGILSHDAVNRATDPYLSSLAGDGERGTGKIETPQFNIITPHIKIMARGWDGKDGKAGRNRIELVDAQSHQVLASIPPPLSDAPKEVTLDTSTYIGRSVYLRFIDTNDASSYAWMGIDSIDAGDDFRIRLDKVSALNGWKSDSPPACITEQFGIPFVTNLQSTLCSELNVGFEAKRILLLGMNVPDSSWYWVGDDFGYLCIEYQDGIVDRYPLIVGESLWWGKRFYTYQDPFTNFSDARRLFKDAIRLYPQKPVQNGMYIASIDTRRGKIIDKISIDSNTKKGSAARIYGVTAELYLKDYSSEANITKGGIIPDSLKAFYDSHALRKSNEASQEMIKKVDAIKNTMYCTEESFPNEFDITKPSTYNGPLIQFEGDSMAHLLTNIFNYNAEDMTQKVTDDGIYHTSTKGAAWYGYDGFGCFTLDESKTTRNHAGFYYDEAWTRDLGRTLCELLALGYTDKGTACADWCLKMARIWEEGDSPDLLINGKRLPRHIHRVLQMPGTAVGMGCFENDGHGLTTMFIYNLWRKLPKRDSWLRSRWRDVKALGDWVVWQLENKDISRATDVLWSDSEASGWDATTGYSVYCDLAQIEALRALTIMAESINQMDTANKWRLTADALKAAVEREYIEKDPIYGNTWTTRYAGWGLSSTLGPLILPTDLHGFDTSMNYPEWHDYNEAAYNRIKSNFRLNAMGYGQGFIVQSALLLDRMQDAEELIKRTERAIYNPTHRPYIVPENVVANEDETEISRMGDLGNGVQQAEIMKAIRLMAGIDDTNPSQLKIMPRIPPCWTKINVKSMPILIESNAQWISTNISYSMERQADNAVITIKSNQPLPATALRLGPFLPKHDSQSASPEVRMNGKAIDGKLVHSGDSYWVWTSIPVGTSKCSIEVHI